MATPRDPPVTFRLPRRALWRRSGVKCWFRKACTAHAPYEAMLCALVIGTPLLAQVASPGSSSTGSSSSATQLPLSGRGAGEGSVSTQQSITNSGGTNSVNVLNSTVSPSGAYAGSIPNGRPIDTSRPLTLDDALALGMRNNLGPISQNNAVLQARGERLVAR